MSADDDLLMRALDGELSEAEESALAERLRQEPELARQLMRHARTDALLTEVAGEAKAAPEGVTEREKKHLGGLLTMAAILLISVASFWTLFTAAPVAITPVITPAMTQDENRVRQAWPKLTDAWRAIDQIKADDSDPMSDEHLKAMNKIHAAFQAAGWLDTQPEYAPGALKQLFKLRQSSEPVRKQKTQQLVAAVQKLKELKDKGLDDEDTVQDAMTAIRALLKERYVTADDTPAWLKRRLITLTRTLVLDEAYPEPAKASEEQARQVRAWIVGLGAEDPETRDAASRDLAEAGEIAAPFLREALSSADKEVTVRASKLLGIGHAPWKAVPDVPDEAQRLLRALQTAEAEKAAWAAKEAAKGAEVPGRKRK
jgi:hypothetical protein